METLIGICGFLCMAAIMLSLFKSKTVPAVAFILFPTILGILLTTGGLLQRYRHRQLNQGGLQQYRTDCRAVRVQRALFQRDKRGGHVRRYC